MEYYSAIKMNYLIHAMMDELQMHNTKWNKSDTRDYILMSRKGKSRDRKQTSGYLLQQVGRWLTGNGHERFYSGEENNLKLIYDDDCTT